MSKKQAFNKISELISDDKNFNKGSEFGNSLVEKSLRKFGAARSIVVDKNNRIIAGNKTVENAAAIGMENVQFVESDGKTIIAVRRNDIDLDSPQGREMALADNQAAAKNIVLDAELIEATLGEAVCEEWGIDREAPDNTKLISKEAANAKLSERFIVPPFSVLDTKQGYWQERKRYWLALGIKSEMGRGGQITFSEAATIGRAGRSKESFKINKGLGAVPANAEMNDENLNHYRKQKAESRKQKAESRKQKAANSENL
jgi:hypothetical protein